MLEINPTMFANDKAHFVLSGAAGHIEIATSQTNSQSANKVMVICHPHPLYGGTMENKVVTTLMRTFNNMGFKTVRFNFRGVGASTGQHASGIGEAKDLVTVLDWVDSVLPQDELWLAGFSFGAYVAYRVAVISQYKDKIKQLVLVAPPVTYPEFKTLAFPTMPWLIVQGEADEVVEPQAVFAWLDNAGRAARLVRIPAASHFFHGELITLKNSLVRIFQ